MEESASRERDLTAYASGLFAALWVVLAVFNPGNTYHIAPVLVGAGFPVAHRVRHGRMWWPDAIGAGVGGFLVVAIVTGLLALLDKLEGPTLLGFGNAAVEALIFGAIGSLLGMLIAWVPLPWDD